MGGRDVLACAQTGTGKTGGFALPMLHKLAAGGRRAERAPAALVLAPTRELAKQIDDAIADYARHLPFIRHTLLIGGVAMGPQLRALRMGVDIVVATPGRLRDHMEQRSAVLDRVSTVVLDEADRMLDLGFVRDVRAILSSLSAKRQTLLFSATLPSSVLSLAKEFMHDAAQVAAAAQGTTPTRVEQRAYHLHAADKRRALVSVLSKDEEMVQTIVFVRTKHGADKLARLLCDKGLSAAALHGNKTQRQRLQALHNFRMGRTPVLVATDLAARGIDVQGISHVVNFDLPQVAEDYVHRIGRTGRANESGIALTFVTAEDHGMLRSIERLTKQPIDVWELEGFAAAKPPPMQTPPPRRRRWRGRAA